MSPHDGISALLEEEGTQSSLSLHEQVPMKGHVHTLGTVSSVRARKWALTRQ